MQKKFIKEFIQYEANPQKISKYICEILNNPKELNELKNSLGRIKNLIGEKGASEKAANIILDSIKY